MKKNKDNTELKADRMFEAVRAAGAIEVNAAIFQYILKIRNLFSKVGLIGAAVMVVFTVVSAIFVNETLTVCLWLYDACFFVFLVVEIVLIAFTNKIYHISEDKTSEFVRRFIKNANALKDIKEKKGGKNVQKEERD